jgi:hypothetical protein
VRGHVQRDARGDRGGRDGEPLTAPAELGRTSRLLLAAPSSIAPQAIVITSSRTPASWLVSK